MGAMEAEEGRGESGDRSVSKNRRRCVTSFVRRQNIISKETRDRRVKKSVYVTSFDQLLVGANRAIDRYQKIP
jgi:hypothetical protein